jgi:hypothetical protein
MGARTCRRSAALSALGAVVVLGGCMGIPTSGEVHSAEVAVQEPDTAIPVPAGPAADATPDQIVQGFLAAVGAGVYDDYETARKFLTGEAASTTSGWTPDADTTVYSQTPDIELRENGDVLVSVDAVATVDKGGRYVESSPGARPQLTFDLDEEAPGQWRIAGLQDGVLMDLPTFRNTHREMRVYFASPGADNKLLVPELRWFPVNRVVHDAVYALVDDGPSTWLRDGVVTGVPEGVELSNNGVVGPVDGVVTVNLVSNVSDQPERDDRNLLQAQLDATIGRRPGTMVTDINVTLGGSLWEPSTVPDLESDPSTAAGPFMIADGTVAGLPEEVDVLAELREGEVVPVEGAAPLTGLVATHPAVSLDGQVMVVLDGATRLMLVPSDGTQAQPLLAGTELVAPSIDRFGWIWTGEATTGALRAVTSSGQVVEVAAGWLEGREVRSVRVSRDGARVAVAYQGPDGGWVIAVAAVIRDENDVPQSLSDDPLGVGQSLIDVAEVSWLDEVTLAVLVYGQDAEEPTVYEVPLGGPTEPMPLLDGAAGIAATKDRLYLVTDDGVLMSRQGATWTEAAGGVEVEYPVFPG